MRTKPGSHSTEGLWSDGRVGMIKSLPVFDIKITNGRANGTDPHPCPLEPGYCGLETDHVNNAGPQLVDSEEPRHAHALGATEEKQAPSCSGVLVKHLEHVYPPLSMRKILFRFWLL